MGAGAGSELESRTPGTEFEAVVKDIVPWISGPKDIALLRTLSRSCRDKVAEACVPFSLHPSRLDDGRIASGRSVVIGVDESLAKFVRGVRACYPSIGSSFPLRLEFHHGRGTIVQEQVDALRGITDVKLLWDITSKRNGIGYKTLGSLTSLTSLELTMNGTIHTHELSVRSSPYSFADRFDRETEGLTRLKHLHLITNGVAPGSTMLPTFKALTSLESLEVQTFPCAGTILGLPNLRSLTTGPCAPHVLFGEHRLLTTLPENAGSFSSLTSLTVNPKRGSPGRRSVTIAEVAYLAPCLSSLAFLCVPDTAVQFEALNTLTRLKTLHLTVASRVDVVAEPVPFQPHPTLTTLTLKGTTEWGVGRRRSPEIDNVVPIEWTASQTSLTALSIFGSLPIPDGYFSCFPDLRKLVLGCGRTITTTLGDLPRLESLTVFNHRPPDAAWIGRLTTLTTLNLMSSCPVEIGSILPAMVNLKTAFLSDVGLGHPESLTFHAFPPSLDSLVLFLKASLLSSCYILDLPPPLPRHIVMTGKSKSQATIKAFARWDAGVRRTGLHVVHESRFGRGIYDVFSCQDCPYSFSRADNIPAHL